MHHVEVITRLEGEQIEDLEDLIEATTAADGHEPVGEHKFLRLKHGDDLAIGVLAYEGDRLVGYAHTLTFGTGEERRVSCEMTVHPDFRRHGIGRTLLTHVVKHAESQGARRLDVWSYNDSVAGRAMAEAFHLEETRRLLHMHRHPGPPPLPDKPAGASIRTFRPGEDAEMWLHLNNRVFAGHPENGNWTLEDFQVRARQPWFSPDDLLILEIDGKPAGFHWLKVRDRTGEGRVGEVYIIGIAPEYHGRGLGRYLVAEGLTHLSQRGVDAVAVYVDQANERAVALYWSFEFHHHHVDVLYSMPLSAASAEERAAAAAG
ncbi:MAG: mycothiol synthase [Dehalococcoidia bacterium]